MIRRPPRSTLVPDTTLFRSRRTGAARMKPVPDSLQSLIDRFDRDRFDMPGGRARVRLGVKDVGAWDLEAQPHRHRIREAKAGNEPDAELSADARTWNKVAGDLQGGMAAYRAGKLTVRKNMHLGVGFLAATNGDTDGKGLTFETVRTKLGRVSTMSAGEGKTIVMLHGLGATKIEFMP